jgi:hypothetical protein
MGLVGKQHMCSFIPKSLMKSRTTSGPVPVQLLRMKAQGKAVLIPSGLTLPNNIGNLGVDIMSRRIRYGSRR